MTATTLQEQVATEIRALLARRRITARQLAWGIGWSDVYISRRLNSHTAFDLNDLEKIAAYLEVPLRTLFGEGEQAPRVLSAVPALISAEGMTNVSLSTPLVHIPALKPSTCIDGGFRTSRSRPFLAVAA